MKTNLRFLAITALFACVIHTGHAGPVEPLTPFATGQTAKASEVNGNFNKVKTAVDSNDLRITVLESGAASPNVTGNITLVPSTADAGNILKGTGSFIHNFGSDNTFLGVGAGNFTMSGVQNTASGVLALHFNTSGFNNTASGGSALFRNTTGNYNTASGLSALFSNTTGGYNTASGAFALFSNTTGIQNTASGVSALFSNTTGSNNTASGVSALESNTTGGSNIALGTRAGSSLTTGSSNIDIGNTGIAGESSTIRIGTAGTHAAAFIAGIRGVTTANANAVAVVIDSAGQLGTASSSRRVKDDIADMGEASRTLMKMRPVTFHYKSDKNPNGRTLQYGLVAEEVAQVAPGLVARSADGRIETVYYQFLAPMLLNEYQKQQRTIAAQAAKLIEQRAELKEQTTRIAQLEKHGVEIAELKQQLTRMAVLLGRLEQTQTIATAAR